MNTAPRYSLRAIALSVLVCASGLATVTAQERVGVNSAVNQAATGTPPGSAPRRLVLGQEVVFNERIATGEGGQTEVLFLDESTMSVGPNSDMVIDEFVYDPRAGTGKLAANLTRGVFRFVGGKLSKQDNAVTMQTPSATIGIRGGLILVNLTAAGQLQVIFGYGAGVTITGANGISQTITRPGFQVTVAGRGATPSEPAPTPPGTTAGLLAQLDGRAGGSGGASRIPTDATVASSGVSTAISSSLLLGVQAEAQRPPNIGTVVRQTVPPTTLQNTAVPSNPQILAAAAAQNNIGTGTGGGTGGGGGGTGGGGGGGGGTGGGSPTAGLFKSTNGNTATNGFVDQSAAARIPYTDGTLANGFLTSSLGGAGNLRVPLGPGSQTFDATGTSSPLGPVRGTSFMSADGSFFYANLTPVNAPTQREFVFGGKPVNPSFYEPTGSVRIFAFNVQPDAALQSQIPFITNNTGGSLANPAISPFYVVAPANSAFGSFNPTTNPSGSAARTLQASLAVNGQGVNQSSALVINTGTFATSSDTGKVVGSGIVRGSFQGDGSTRPVRIGSGVATVPDGFNNNLFGSDQITGFVLDQNQYNANLNFQQQLATQVPFGSSATNYAFTQPVTATALSASVGTSRTTQTLSGFYGGIISPQTVGSGFGSPYTTGGAVGIATDATSNRVTATFAGADLSGRTSNTLLLNFGGLTGRALYRSAFIDDKNFAALESPDTPSQVNGVNIQLNGDPTQASRIAMVTSGTVPSTSLLPAGVSYCQCQYLQWGYWTGELDTPNAAGTSVVRRDVAHINTWVAGIPTPIGDLNTLAAQGATGTYNGHLVGSVFNNGAQYLAAGGLNATYNFGTRAASFAVSNYDGRSFTARGTVNPITSVNAYTFTANNPSGLPLSTTFTGSFYGPMAAETGGNFTFRSTAGPNYLTSGIFAAKR